MEVILNDYNDDVVMICFSEVFYRRKYANSHFELQLLSDYLSLSSLQTYNTSWEGFEPTQNLIFYSAELSCAVAATNTLISHTRQQLSKTNTSLCLLLDK